MSGALIDFQPLGVDPKDVTTSWPEADCIDSRAA